MKYIYYYLLLFIVIYYLFICLFIVYLSIIIYSLSIYYLCFEAYLKPVKAKRILISTP